MSTVQKSNKRPKTQDPKAFSDHINELRMRVMWVALAFIITSAVAYQYREILIDIVLSPLGHQKLIYLTPAGGFAFIFQITMYAGAVVTAPVFIYQLYKFVQPALPKRATHHSLKIIFASVLLMIAGVVFGYFVAVPSALHFLTSFAGSYIDANLTADSYLNFIVAYVVGLGLLFQLPLLLIFWNWISPMSGKKIISSEKFIILFSFIAAAVITPTPDPANQALVAVPIILIYQVGVISVLVLNKRHRARTVKTRVQSKNNAQTTVAMPVIPSVKKAPQLTVMTTTPNVVRPISPVQPTVSKPKPAGTIDGIRHVRPTRIQPVVRRLDTPLTPPPRPLVNRPGRRSISLDGVSRVFPA